MRLMDHFQGVLSLQLLLIHTTSTISESAATAISNGFTQTGSADSCLQSVVLGMTSFFPECAICLRAGSIHHLIPSCPGLDYSGVRNFLLHTSVGEMCGPGMGGGLEAASLCWIFSERRSSCPQYSTIKCNPTTHAPPPQHTTNPTESSLRQLRT